MKNAMPVTISFVCILAEMIFLHENETLPTFIGIILEAVGSLLSCRKYYPTVWIIYQPA